MWRFFCARSPGPRPPVYVPLVATALALRALAAEFALQRAGPATYEGRVIGMDIPLTECPCMPTVPPMAWDVE